MQYHSEFRVNGDDDSDRDERGTYSERDDREALRAGREILSKLRPQNTLSTSADTADLSTSADTADHGTNSERDDRASVTRKWNNRTAADIHQIFQQPEFLIKTEISFAVGLVHAAAMEYFKQAQVQIACGVWDKKVVPAFDALVTDEFVKNEIMGPHIEIVTNLGWTGSVAKCKTMLNNFVQAQKVECKRQMQDYYEFPKKLAVLLGPVTFEKPFEVKPSSYRSKHWVSGLGYANRKYRKKTAETQRDLPVKKCLTDSECKVIMKAYIEEYDAAIARGAELQHTDGVTRYLIGVPCQEEPETFRELTLDYVNSDNSVSLSDPKYVRLVEIYKQYFVRAFNQSQGVETMHFTAQKGAMGGYNSKDDYTVHMNNALKNSKYVFSEKFAPYYIAKRNELKATLGSKEAIFKHFQSLAAVSTRYYHPKKNLKNVGSTWY